MTQEEYQVRYLVNDTWTPFIEEWTSERKEIILQINFLIKTMLDYCQPKSEEEIRALLKLFPTKTQIVCREDGKEYIASLELAELEVVEKAHTVH